MTARIKPRRRRLLIPVAFGVVLVAVPTAYSIFPGWARAWAGWRALTLVAWLVAAVVGVRLTAKADSDLQASVSQEQRQAQRVERRATISDRFRALLVPGAGGIPAHYQVTVYGPSPDGRFLIPLFPPALDYADPAIFPSGAGAVGRAWEADDGVFVVVGQAVSDDTYGLTAAQHRRYRMYQAVATAVIHDYRSRPIGVLSAISSHHDTFFLQEDGVDALRDLADGLSWLVPQALAWMMPQEEEP